MGAHGVKRCMVLLGAGVITFSLLASELEYSALVDSESAAILAAKCKNAVVNGDAGYMDFCERSGKLMLKIRPFFLK